MERMRMLGLIAMGALTAACVSLAPGAEKVTFTKTAADVAGCQAVGNVRLPQDAQGNSEVLTADTELRNQAVGHGGDTVFITASTLGAPFEGVAYRCH